MKPPSAPLSGSPFSALVVEPSEPDMIRVVSALTGAGFTVSATDNYQDAQKLLATHPPLVLITEVRLGAYNGLQLALRARSTAPGTTVIVVSSVPDIVLLRDADRAAATFALKPFTDQELLAAVYRTAMRRPNDDGGLEPIRPPFERRAGDRRVSSLEIEIERRRGDRRKDIASLLIRAAALV
jgi:DNA-binding NtrC family response regulator